MSSDLFVLQLILLSLHGLGYGNIAEQLDEEVAHRNPGKSGQQLTTKVTKQVKKIEWFYDLIQKGNYLEAEAYIERGIAEFDVQNGKVAKNQEVPLPSLLVEAADTEKKLIMLIILYFVKRTLFFDALLSKEKDSRVDQNFLIDYLKTSLLPTLDQFYSDLKLLLEKNKSIIEIDDNSVLDDVGKDGVFKLWHIFDSEVLNALVNFDESLLLLGLVMSFPYVDDQLKSQVLQESKYFFGFNKGFQRRVRNVSVTLREDLSMYFLSNVFKFTEHKHSKQFHIPNDCLEKIIKQATLYQKQENPSYLPPRTNRESKLRSNEEYPRYLTGGYLTKSNHHHKNHHFSSRLLHTLTENTSEVWFAKFSPLGRYLVTGSGDGKLILYDVTKNFEVIKILASSTAMDNANFVPAGTKWASNDSKAIVYCCWDPDEEFLVSSCVDTVTRVWFVGNLLETTRRRNGYGSNDLLPYKLLSCFKLGDNIRSWTCEFLPDTVNHKGKFLISSPDKILKLYDVNGLEIFDFHASIYETNLVNNSLHNVDVDEDEDDDYVGLDNEEKDGFGFDAHQSQIQQSRHKTTRTEQESRLTDTSEFFNRIVDFLISPNGKILISVDRANELQFFRLPDNFNDGATTKRIAVINVGIKVAALTISTNGKFLLLSAAPVELQVWDISGIVNSEDPTHFQLPRLHRKLYSHSHGSSIIRSCFGYLVEKTKEEELVLSGSFNGFVYAWQLQTGQIIARIPAHEGTCNMVDWNLKGSSAKNGSRDYGKLWCSVGDDKIVKIWGPSDWV